MTDSWHLLTEDELSSVAGGWFRILARMIANRPRRVACGSRLYVFRVSSEGISSPSVEAA